MIYIPWPIQKYGETQLVSSFPFRPETEVVLLLVICFGGAYWAWVVWTLCLVGQGGLVVVAV